MDEECKNNKYLKHEYQYLRNVWMYEYENLWCEVYLYIFKSYTPNQRTSIVPWVDRHKRKSFVSGT